MKRWRDVRSSRMMRRTSSSIARFSRRSAAGRAGSRSAGSPGVTSEPAWRARSPTCCAAPGGAGASRCGCASCGAPLGVDHGVERLADRDPAMERAAMDDQAGDRLLRVRRRRTRRCAARLAEHALIADLAAALGVEGRPVEDDLGLASAGRSARRTRSPSRRIATTLPVGASSSRSPGTGVAGARLDRLVERLHLGVLGELGLLAAAAALALLGERRFEPGAVDARRRTRPRARPSGRSGSRTCHAGGTRRRPAARGVGGQVLRAATDHPLGAGRAG